MAFSPSTAVVLHRSLTERESSDVHRFTDALRYAGVDADVSFYHHSDINFDWDDWQTNRMSNCDRVLLVDSPGLFLACQQPPVVPLQDKLVERLSHLRRREGRKIVRIALNSDVRKPDVYFVSVKMDAEKGIPVLTNKQEVLRDLRLLSCDRPLQIPTAKKSEIFRIPRDGTTDLETSAGNIVMFNTTDLKKSPRVQIGEGGFGKVYKADLPVALKQVREDVSRKPRRNDLTDLEKEINILIRLQGHPNIVKLIGYYKHLGNHEIVLEYVDGKDLKFLLQRPIDKLLLVWNHRIDICCQIADGLHHLHTQDPFIIHMDLKPRNILVLVESHKFYCKITDYGLSKSTGISEEGGKYSASVGTTEYMAPERFRSQLFVKSDVYSFGMTMLAIRDFTSPFQGKSQREIVRCVTSGETPELDASEQPPQNYDSVMKQCWSPSHQDRPSMSDICSHLEKMHHCYWKMDTS